MTVQKGNIMQKDIFILVTVMFKLSLVLVFIGWNMDGWLGNLALIGGGIFGGYALTEVLNAPTV